MADLIPNWVKHPIDTVTDAIPNWVKHPVDTYNNWHPVDDAVHAVGNKVRGEFGLAPTPDKPAADKPAGSGVTEVDTSGPKDDSFGATMKDAMKKIMSGDIMSGIMELLGALFKPLLAMFGGLFGGSAAAETPAADTPAAAGGKAQAGGGVPTKEEPGIIERAERSVADAYHAAQNKLSHIDTSHLMGDASDYVKDKWHAVTEKFGAKPEPLHNVMKWAEKYDVAGIEDKNGLPHGTILAIVDNESRGREGLVSPKGAEGLTQFIPSTAKRFHIDPNKPEEALEGAGAYMGELSKKFHGHLPSMFAAYNMGEGNVDKFNSGKWSTVNHETSDYVGRAMALMPAYAEATVAIASAKAQGSSTALASAKTPDHPDVKVGDGSSADKLAQATIKNAKENDAHATEPSQAAKLAAAAIRKSQQGRSDVTHVADATTVTTTQSLPGGTGSSGGTGKTAVGASV